MRRIALALIFTVAFSGLALAAVENIKVSGDITVQGLSRDLSLGNTEYDSGWYNRDAEAFILSQVRLRFDADLTENVSAVVGLINERIWGDQMEQEYPEFMWGNSPGYGEEMFPSETTVSLDIGYFRMKDMFDYPMTVKIGRQPIKFGKGLIIGDPDPTLLLMPAGSTGVVLLNGQDGYVQDGGLKYIADDLSLQKSFDAVRTTLDYSPWVLDLVYAKSWEGNTEMDDDITLMGVNASYDFDENTQLEGYLWSKKQDDSPMLDYLFLSPDGPEDEEDAVYTVGFRGETAVTDQLSLFGEYAYQFGDYVNITNALAGAADIKSDRDAFAVQVGGGFLFDDDNNSGVSLTYTYLSGDDDLESNTWEQWDPMYEDQRGGEIANLFFNTGVQCVMLSGSTMPREDLTALLDVYWYRLTATTTPQLFDGAPGSSLILYATGPLRDNWYWVDRNERDLGWEVDASLVYDYTEDVQMGLVSAWFMPGDFFADINDETAYQVRAYAKVDF